MSKALRPYYFLDYGDELSRQELSPERGQLLLALAEANVDMSDLLKKADFSRSLLPRIRVEDKNLAEGKLTYVDADGCYLYNCNFSKSNFHGARFLGGDIVKCNLSFSKFFFTNFWGTRFAETDFSGADFTNAMMSESYNFQNCNFRNASFHHAFVTDSTWLDDMHNVINDVTVFDKSWYKLVAYSGDRKITLEKTFDIYVTISQVKYIRLST